MYRYSQVWEETARDEMNICGSDEMTFKTATLSLYVPNP